MAQQQLNAELVLNTHSVLGEGAIWNYKEKKLYWIDIEQGLLHIFDPVSIQNHSIKLGQQVGTVVPTTQGNALVALKDGIYLYRFNTAALELAASNPENNSTGNRFNDGKCDPAGRLWVGTMGDNYSGALYRLDANRNMHVMKTGVGTSNGIVWSADKKKMYYIDTPTRKVVSYDYDNKTGNINNPKDVIFIPDGMGYPDGSTIDSEGMIWIAHWGGYCVTRWNPDTGEMLCKVNVPSAHVTSCAFGGKNLDILYITTASTGITGSNLEQYPHSGGLFSVYPGVNGFKCYPFSEKK